MTTSLRRIVALVVLALSVAPRSYAGGILDNLPEGAIGFVVIRDLEGVNKKIERVTAILQEAAGMPIPAPLPVIKAATGLGPGLDERGDALLVLMPGERGIADPHLLLLVSIADYKEFAGSINGDVSGEICRVAVAGEDILIAKHDNYVAMMNVEHRDELQALVTGEAHLYKPGELMRRWLEGVDATAVLTQEGAKLLTGEADEPSNGEGGSQSAPNELSEVQSTVRAIDESLEMFNVKIGSIAAGITIDDEANVKVGSQVVLAEPNQFLAAAGTFDSAALPLKPFADDSYIAAVGGLVPEGFAEAATRWLTEFVKRNPKSHGFEKLTEGEWKSVEQSWRSYLGDITSASFITFLGRDDDPLVSNFYGMLDVDDADAYLSAYLNSIDLWNELLKRSTSDIKLEYKLSEVEVAGREALLTTIDLGAAAQDPNVPMTKFIMDAVIGEEGVLRLYVVRAGDNKVLFAIDKPDDVAETLEAATQGASTLAGSQDVQQTLSLLQSPATWTGVISPKGFVTWLGRLGKFMSQLGPGVPEIPDFPDSPPVGLALTASAEQLTVQMAVPSDVLRSLAAYAKTLQASF